MKSIVFNTRDYEIPYETQPERRVYAHLDLRAHPELIDTVPELQQAPPFKSQVIAFNDPHGCFVTHGCSCSGKKPGIFKDVVIPVPLAANGPFWCTTYLLFSFWLLDDNTSGRYQEMFDAYAFERTDYSICFELQKAYFWTPDEIRAGLRDSRAEWSTCVLWTSGWGDTQPDANARWEIGNQDILRYLRDYNSRHYLDTKAGVTVGERMSRRNL